MAFLPKEGLFVMDFKAIEKAIDPIVLGYIKDSCFEKVYDRTGITEIGKGKFGTVYRSAYIYKNKLNEEKYRQLVREHYLNSVQPALEKEEQKKPRKRAKRELGKNVTQEEFLKTIFRDNFEHRKGQVDKKGRRINMHSFLMNIDPELKVIDGKTVAHNFEKMLQKARKYGYFTPNMFISYQSFTKELLTLLGVIILDFDLDKVGMVLSKEELFKYIKKKLKVEPSMIWDTKTKGNYQVAILIEPMAATPKAVHLYEQVVKEMIYELGDMCDLACYNANHIFSMGQNNKHKKKFIRKYNDEIHSINEFRWLLLKRDERRKKEVGSSNVVDFTREGVRRDPAIQALFNGEVSWRNHACFTLSLVMRFLGYSEEETENYILSIWVPVVKNKADHVFTNAEALKCIQHAYSGKYRCFHSNWVETVTGLECNLKGFFRGYAPYQNQGIYVTDTETRFKEFLRENGGSFIGTIAEVMDKIGVKRTALKDTITKMCENGELDYLSQRGRYAKTTFTLIEQANELPVIQLEAFKPIEEQIQNLDELEQAISEMGAV